MIVGVTTLGSRSDNAAGAAAAVVKYLEGSSRTERAGRHPGPSPELPGVEPTDGMVAYYADSMAAPGIWMGQGLTGVALSGLADPEQLERVLLGRLKESPNTPPPSTVEMCCNSSPTGPATASQPPPSRTCPSSSPLPAALSFTALSWESASSFD